MKVSQVLPGAGGRLAGERLVAVEPDSDESVVLHFSGTPGSLRGAIPLRNDHDRRVSLTRVDGLSATLAGEPGVVLMRPARVSRATVWMVGETRHVPVTLAVPRHTPPGRYESELVVGGQHHAAV